MCDSVDGIFEAFGGPKAVGDVLGIPRTHAGTIKARGSIPSRYWPALVSAAEKRGIEGVTFEVLAKIAANKEAAA